MDKLIFYNLKNKEDLVDLIKKNRKICFNFLNSHDVYLFKKDKLFQGILNELKNNSYNFLDGSIISLFLNSKKLRGTEFTEFVLKNKSLLRNKSHFFIGLKDKDLDFIAKKYPSLERKKLFTYNPPYIKDMRFRKDEINKISNLINKKKVSYIWIGLGSPKQNILAYDLFKKTNFDFMFNVGAALDFIAEKKKQAPKIIQEMRIEWFYRLITDFRHTKKKVWRSLIGSFYAIKLIKLDNEK